MAPERHADCRKSVAAGRGAAASGRSSTSSGRGGRTTAGGRSRRTTGRRRLRGRRSGGCSRATGGSCAASTTGRSRSRGGRGGLDEEEALAGLDRGEDRSVEIGGFTLYRCRPIGTGADALEEVEDLGGRCSHLDASRAAGSYAAGRNATKRRATGHAA